MSPKDNKQTPAIIPNNPNDSAVAERKDVYSSYVFASSNRSLSKYGERLLMEVISVAQEYIIDAALGQNKLNFAEKYNERFAIVDIPIRNLLDVDNRTNYTNAKQAAVELMKIYHTVETPVSDKEGRPVLNSDGSRMYKFETYHLLDKVVINEKPGIVSVKLGEDTWSQILEMGKGYTRYNLLTAKKLNNVTAIRLFQIVSNSSVPMTFSIERLRDIFGMKDKYVGNTPGFIKRIIIPAEEEIAQKCPFKVVHETNYESTGKCGRSSIASLTFTKESKTAPSPQPLEVLGQEIINLLIRKFGFDNHGVYANISLFKQAKDKGIDIRNFLERIEANALKANVPAGYIVRSLKNLVEGKEGSVQKVVSVNPVIVLGKKEKDFVSDMYSGSGLEEL